MPLRIDDTSHELPGGESSAQKATAYNTLLTALGVAWTSWTPTWTNLNATGATVVAKYRRIGTLVFCRLSIVLSNATPISGSVSFSLPVERAAYGGSAGFAVLGYARLVDTSTTTYESIITNPTTTTALIAAIDVSGTYSKGAVLSSTVPFTWTTNDEIHAEFWYECVTT